MIELSESWLNGALRSWPHSFSKSRIPFSPPLSRADWTLLRGRIVVPKISEFKEIHRQTPRPCEVRLHAGPQFLSIWYAFANEFVPKQALERIANTISWFVPHIVFQPEECWCWNYLTQKKLLSFAGVCLVDTILTHAHMRKYKYIFMYIWILLVHRT